MNRRHFLEKSILGTCVTLGSPILGHGFNLLYDSLHSSGSLKLSLAQWSLNRQFFGGHLNPADFAETAIKTYGIKAIEYVNQFYTEQAEDEKFWHEMKKRADSEGVRSVLIMVDHEGELGSADEKARKIAVENHYKWAHAAKILGCHSIRVNAFGDTDKETYRGQMVKSISELADYTANEGLNVIIENHGLFSSNAEFIVEILKEVKKPNIGTLTDFGNWCTSALWGSTIGSCDVEYDKYKGVAEFMPFTQAISAKSYNFSSEGDETKIDYYRLIQIVKEAGYSGHISVEYEGDVLSEHEGIIATKNLIKKAWNS